MGRRGPKKGHGGRPRKDGRPPQPPRKKIKRVKTDGKRGPTKGTGGRSQKLMVDDNLIRQVEAMAGLGLTLEQISLILGIGETTLHEYRKNFPKLSDAYQKGRSKGALDVTSSLRTLIKAGNTSATIFYLKTQCRWKETKHVEHTGEDGAPIQIYIPDNKRGKVH